MNLVRSTISFFLVILVALCVLGWIWVGGHFTEKLAGARCVLAICGLSSLGALTLLWTAKHPVAD